MKISRFSTIALMITLFIHADITLAEWRPSDTEMSRLPAYCKARFAEGSPEFASWRNTLGQDFIHVHHYCAGLNFINRSFGITSKNDREGTLIAAVREIDYVLKHSSPSFSLIPEMYMYRGIANSLMKRDTDAFSDASKAVEKNPRLAKAYHLLADHYERIQEKSRALEIVIIGLQHNPSSKSLQKRYLELGGKLPYPEPIQQATPNKGTAPTEEEKPKVDESTRPPVKATEEPPPQTNIGSPSNPYCRFCTD